MFTFTLGLCVQGSATFLTAIVAQHVVLFWCKNRNLYENHYNPGQDVSVNRAKITMSSIKKNHIGAKVLI